MVGEGKGNRWPDSQLGEVREMRNAETELTVNRGNLAVVTGKRSELESLMGRLGGGGWKSICKDNSLAAYLTARGVLKQRRTERSVRRL